MAKAGRPDPPLLPGSHNVLYVNQIPISLPKFLLPFLDFSGVFGEKKVDLRHFATPIPLEMLPVTMRILAGILVGSVVARILFDACTWLTDRAASWIARRLAWYWALLYRDPCCRRKVRK